MDEYYVPGTEETDPKKIIMSLQQAQEKAATNADDIATNTAAIAALAAVVAAIVVPTAATQAEEEAASSIAKFASPGRQQFHPLHPKAWAYVTQAAGVYTLAASSGVSGISKAATGRVDITPTTFSSANFGFVAMGNEGGIFCSEIIASRTASNARVLIRSPSSVDTDSSFTALFFGDQ